ncbi:MAG: GNAT family N-acetyltransferase [Parachlamydiales bacterium]|nr:GNAT family N-acetyltransferase [Candidatus Acheromyda pituitae]
MLSFSTSMETQLVQTHLPTAPTWCDQACNQLTSCLESKVFKVFMSALAGAVVAAAVAIVFSWTVAILPVVLIAGAATGTAANLVYDWWASPNTAERFQELEQVANVFQGTPRVLQAVRAVDNFIRSNPIRLQQSYDYHNFHHELTVITEQIRDRPDLCRIWDIGTVWEAFLDRIEGTTVHQPDSRAIVLHVGMERERLAGRNIEVITDRLNPASPQFERDCAQLFAIEDECFAGNTTANPQWLREQWQSPQNHVHLARRADTQEILGYVWVREEQDTEGHPVLHIPSVARKAEACSLGVASRIFQQVFAQPLNRFNYVYLEVRESNRDAIALYDRLGFRQATVYPGYYTYPLENALVMTRPSVIV